MKRVVAALAFLVGLSSSAFSAQLPLITGVQEVGNLNAVLNRLIGQINAGVPLNNGSAFTISNLTPGSYPIVNGIMVTGGYTGKGVTIGTTGADTNVDLIFATQGTGLLRFGNGPDQSMWVPSKGLDRCPGVSYPQKSPIGVGTLVTGFLLVKDWFGRQHSIPTCGYNEEQFTR